MPGRIDVHHHFLPPEYALAWKNSGQIPPGLHLPPWNVEGTISFLDRNDIQLAMISLSAPGLDIASSPEEARSLARKCNEIAAGIRDAHPERFGFFATLPLDDVASGLDELSYALDVLKADGVTLFTSYKGKYLGNADFKPLWKELDQRAAVVFVHPASPGKPSTAQDHILPPPLIDFPHETTKTAVHLITSNTVRDHPNCKIILSHGGGTLPYIVTRIANAAADAGLLAGKTADEVLSEAKKFYFDLALTSYTDPITLLSSFAAEDHILWGSDYPFARDKTVKSQTEDFKSLQMKPAAKESMTYRAALKLFPRLGHLSCFQRTD
ncbi:amidohydrolase family protein [Hypoxylon sp. FL1857]|nr:amidohydrolase family protein [Hypoxylon sp. FL1857]